MRDLPAELIYTVFTFLGARDLSKCTRVCFTWHMLSKDDPLWKSLTLTHWKHLKRTADHLRNPVVPWQTFFASNFHTANLSFLIVGAEGGGEKDERLEDVRSKILSCGIGTVDTFNARIKTPTPDLLNKYNAILFFSYHGFNQHEVGNLLASYVDNGGGVVIGTYTNCGRGNRLEGRWCEAGYDPIVLGTTSRTKTLAVGITTRSHPIFRGVRTFNGGTQSSHGDGKLHPQATLIAEWANGRPLVAEQTRFTGRVVGVNFYPPSADAAEGCWDPNTDGKHILANALLYATTAGKL